MTENARKKIYRMYELFGHCENNEAICKNCKHLTSYTASRKWYKCECFGNSSSESTDWRIGWLACGLYNKPYDGKPVVEIRTRKKKKDLPVDGQMEMEL